MRFSDLVPKLRREDEAKCQINCITDYLFAKANCAGYHKLRLYLQEQALRAITNSDYRTHSAPLFSKLGILDIFQVNTFEIAKFMFYYRNKLLPPLLLNLFVTNSKIHNYGTRTASNYRTHLCRKNLKQFTILHQGPKICNSTPVSVTRSSNLLSFRTKMQEFLPK